eukprot:evm.model.scf_4521.1 EVM.evm.TU.scf_4521.1   scf_4521:3384-3866(-)
MHWPIQSKEFSSCAVAGRVSQVRYNPDVTGPRDFMHRLKGLTDLGCTVNLQDASAWKSRLEDLETNRLRRLFITSLVFSLPVFILAIILPRVPGAHEAIATQVGGIPIDVLLKWVLTTPVQFIIGYRFHTGAARLEEIFNDLLSSASPVRVSHSGWPTII